MPIVGAWIIFQESIRKFIIYCFIQSVVKMHFATLIQKQRVSLACQRFFIIGLCHTWLWVNESS